MPLLPFVYYLGPPIGQYMDHEIGIAWVICSQMYCIIMLAIHAWVHHKNAGFNLGAFAGLEYHRTDG